MHDVMQFPRHVDHLRTEGERLTAAARLGTGAEPVPGCPGWSLDDLVRHTGTVHLWSTAALEGAGERPPRGFFGTTEQAAPRDHVTLVEWYVAAHGALVEAIDKMDPTTPCWTFLPSPPGAAFWARRQAHETVIHRFDAEGAVGRLTGVDTNLAHDGIDEVLGFIAARGKSLVSDPPVTLGVRSVDSGGRWALRIGPSDRTMCYPADPADADVPQPDATMSGLAADLYLALWNRLDGLELLGDRAVIDLWREHARIT